MLVNLLTNIPIILGSQSPRRKELLAGMGISFEVIVRETDESYDVALSPVAVVRHIAQQKLAAFGAMDFPDHLIITADTIVVFEGEILGKPTSVEEAKATLERLQGHPHQVLTAVALRYKEQQHVFVEQTEVLFSALETDEIAYYVDRFAPLDKAGSYGIQDWIGYIGVQHIKGSYENVVGLPTARLYATLKTMFKNKIGD